MRQLALILILTSALAACSGDRTVPPRDFNELIPRLMGAINNKTPEQAAASLFDVTNPDERRDAIAYLETKKYGHEEPYMKAYHLLATDPAPVVRAQAMRALGSSYNSSVVADLLKGLADKEYMVRRDAAQGLVTAFDESAVVPLAARLREDPDEQVRAWSALALHNSPNQEALRALIDGVGDKDAAVAFWSYDGLVRRSHQNFGVDRRAWLTWYRAAYAPSTQPASQPATATRPAPG